MARPRNNILAEIEDDNIILDEIASGVSQSEICKRMGIPNMTMCDWLSDSVRAARARTARLQSAEAWMLRGKEYLENVAEDATNPQIQKAKLLSEHCYRMAKIVNPREYGDKIDVTGKIDHEHSISSLFDAIIPRPSLLYQDQDVIEGDIVTH